MFFDVKEAKYLEHYRIQLQFEDGSVGIADLSEYPNKDDVFHLFLDMNYFKRFQVQYGTLVWGEGELDIAPETLYAKSTGKSLTYFAMKEQV